MYFILCKSIEVSGKKNLAARPGQPAGPADNSRMHTHRVAQQADPAQVANRLQLFFFFSFSSRFFLTAGPAR